MERPGADLFLSQCLPLTCDGDLCRSTLIDTSKWNVGSPSRQLSHQACATEKMRFRPRFSATSSSAGQDCERIRRWSVSGVVTADLAWRRRRREDLERHRALLGGSPV